MVMEAMRLSLLEHEAQQRREEERARREGATNETTPGEPFTTSSIDESASPRVQSSTTVPLVAAYLTQQDSRADGSSTSFSDRGRSSTPVSGQTTSSSPPGTIVDDLNDISHSVERSITQPTLMTDTPTHIGNGGAHAAHMLSMMNDPTTRAARQLADKASNQRTLRDP